MQASIHEAVPFFMHIYLNFSSRMVTVFPWITLCYVSEFSLGKIPRRGSLRVKLHACFLSFAHKCFLSSTNHIFIYLNISEFKGNQGNVLNECGHF